MTQWAKKSEWRILNLGAGVQSTTVYLMAKANREAFRAGKPLPYPEVGLVDVAIFADTGDEPKAVYKHLDWMESLNSVPILRRSRGVLSNDLMRSKNSTTRCAAIPAYTMMPGDEEEKRTLRQCSKEYKVEVIELAIRRELVGLKSRQRIPKNVRLIQLVGISLDEAGRFERMKKRRTLGIMEAPLIRMFMTRLSCVSWLAEFGNMPHEAPRSACVHCPMHNDEEWAKVKDEPEDWALAVRVDEALRTPGTIVNRGMDAEMFLHRSCKPLVQIDFKPKPEDRQTEIPFWRECLGVCGV